MALPSLSSSTAYARLQDNLRTGLDSSSNLWYYDAKDWVTCVHAADIDQDGDTEVLAGSRDGRVYALSRDGALLWETVVGGKAWVTALVACSSSAVQQIACVIGTRDGKIYVFNQQGKAIAPPGSAPSAPEYWYDVKHQITRMCLDTSQTLTVVFAADDHCTYSLDLTANQLLWDFHVDEQIRALFTYDVDGDGLAETLVGSDDQILHVLSNTGKQRSSCHLDQAIHTLFAADIDRDGEIEILVGTRTKKLFVLTPNLNEKWSVALSSRPIAVTVADVNGDRLPEVLVACDDRSLFILDNAGRFVWRQILDQRYYSLNAFDLDRDGRTEILAGANDSRVYTRRIQLTKDLDKKIRRDYTTLGKPEITTLSDLSNEQLNLLLGVLNIPYGTIDKKLNLADAKAQVENGDFISALLILLKLDQQGFQWLWEKENLGYSRALCLADLAGDQQRKVVVGSHDGGVSVFSAKGRLLWSEKSPDGDIIFDAQSGYLSTNHGEDLAFVSAAGTISVLNADRTRSDIGLQFPERATCFYLFAPGSPTASEILIGTRQKQAYLYTTDFEKPAWIFDLPAAVDRVYISAPDAKGNYRNPELLISTDENQLFAYTRGGNCLWAYQTRSQIRALCVKDLDGDGHLEVLIGLDDCNIYVLDDNGNLRWRYVLYHSVLALETADLNGDGKQEILAGCADGILYVFTSIGDLIWRYLSKDLIQALRVADIDTDNNFEVVMVEESHLEVLRIARQGELDELIAKCWENLFTERNPFEALSPLIKGNDPYLRAAGLLKLSSLDPLPPETFNLLGDAINDPFTNVRKVLPEALMRAYHAEPVRARELLNILFRERQREVSIEVVEHLEILARVDWNDTLSYLERALRSNDRNTRRAALRKISHLLREYAVEIKSARETLGENLFLLLLSGAQDKVPKTSTWVKQEAGRVLADFLNLFEEMFLPYLHRMFQAQLGYETLMDTASNIISPPIQQTVIHLVKLSFQFDQKQAVTMLIQAVNALEEVQLHTDGTDLWLIYRELQALFTLTNLEELASHDFRLKAELFPHTYPQVPSFLRIGEHLNAVTRPLKMFQRRSDPVDRLNSLLNSIGALDNFQRVIDKEYNVSLLPGAPLPLLPEFVALKALVARWQEMFSLQRNELRGHAELVCELQSRTVRWEESVGIWLKIENQGRALARDVQVTLLADESFLRQSTFTFTTDIIQIGQEVAAEFIIKPLQASAKLDFEVTYDNAENDIRTNYEGQLDFVKSHQQFTEIENPYLPGLPIQDKRMFYGRESDLKYLIDNFIRIEAQTVQVLYGQRRSGKTTLLNQLANTDLLAQHVAVKIDLQKMALNLNLNKFFFGISREISKAMLNKGLATLVPQRSDFFGELVDSQLSFELFLDDVIIALKGRKLILLFDEFEELEDHVTQGHLTPEIFKYLRSLVQERHYIHFLLSGTHHIRDLTHSYWSVFFNIALHHRLPSKISAEGAKDLITKPTPNLEYEPLAVRKIGLLTADQPYLINLICHQLVAHCNRMQKNYVTLNDVNLVLKNVLETGAIHFDWLWEEKLKTSLQRLLLLSIAEASKDEGRQLDLDDIKGIFELYNLSYRQDELIHVINYLVAEDVIEKTDDTQHDSHPENARYALTNGLLRQWLRRNQSLHAFLQQPTKPATTGTLRQKQPAKFVESKANDSHTVSDDLSDRKQSTELTKNQKKGLYDTGSIPTARHSPEI